MRIHFLLILIILYACDNTSKEIRTYHKNGELKEVYTLNEDGLIHGQWNKYYDNGQIHQSISMVRGIMNGPQEEYFISGNLHITSTVVNDQPHGNYYEFYETGSRKLLVNYNRGREMIYAKFDTVGKLREIRTHENLNNLMNTTIYFDQYGRIIDSLSNYLILESKGEDIELVCPNKYVDSMKIEIVKSTFNSAITDSMKSPGNSLKLKLKDSHYFDNFFRAKLICYLKPKKSDVPYIKYAPYNNVFYIKFHKDKGPSRYNLYPIYSNE